MIARTRAAALSALGLLALAGRATACHASESAAGGDAGSDALAQDVVTVPRDAWVPPLTDAAHPSPYAGWAHYPDYDPSCEFYIPESPANLPPPLRWQPCRPVSETAGKSCQEMVIDWKPSKAYPNDFITPGTSGFRRADGSVAFMTARFQDDGTYRIVVDASGPTLVAVREQRPDKCVLANMPSDGDRFAFRVLDSEAKGSVSEFGGGAIGGDIGSLRPQVLRRYRDTVARDYAAGIPGVVDITGGPMKLSEWTDLASSEILSAPEDAALKYNYQFFFGNALFWAADGSGINKQKVWTRSAGVKDLLAFGSDVTQGAADLGTDGTTLVWLEGTDRTSGTGIYPSVAAYAAPFTTTAGLVQKRLLRSDLSGYSFGVSPFVAGCGYAARGGFVKDGPGEKGGTILLRLADGHMWLLPSGPGLDWSWQRPLGITCDELFILVQSKITTAQPVRYTIARVRIDSLGTPLPP